jgi:hypothetical protein
MRLRAGVLFGSLLASAAPAQAAAGDELRAELVGRFGLPRAPLASDCEATPTRSKVVSGRPTGSGLRRFAAGELVRVEEVRAGLLSGLEIELEVVELALVSWRDGPFEVFDQRRCRIELEFDVPREVRKDRARALAATAAVVETFDDERAARAAGWNGRRVEPYPEGWEETRREYEAWRVARRNEQVREKTEEVLAAADQVLRYMKNDADYLASFGAGARARTSDSWSSCEAMLSASFSASGSGGEDYAGWADGQKLAWATRLSRALQDCYAE